jgi:hypothetical protein
VRVVVYLRRQDDHLVSRYQQEVKVGCIQRLEDWAERDFSSLYDYHARLRRHEELLAPTALVVRPYERTSFSDGSLHQDFLDAVGVELRADEMVQVEDRNPSLDMEAVEFLRLLNLCRVESGSATPGLIDNRDLVRRLEPASSGPVPTLPAKTLDRFMAQWKRSNKRVARELLGRRNGRLFTTPRKSGNTTTEQRLDPTRLDHFLAVSEVPEELHDALRTLVRREASDLRRPT